MFDLHCICRHTRSLGLGMVALAVTAPAAEAALSSYGGSATLTYTINSVTNLANPGDLSGLEILGSFEQFGDPDSTVFTTGDGSVTAATLNYGPAPVTNSFEYTFETSGGADNGTVNAFHLGSFWLAFNNTDTDNYSVDVTLDYSLHASASGQAADSWVHLDYYDMDNTEIGTDDALAFAGLSPVASQTGSYNYSFTLGGNSQQALIGDVGIAGNVEAAVVPLPPAIWIFLSGCAALLRGRWNVGRL